MLPELEGELDGAAATDKCRGKSAANAAGLGNIVNTIALRGQRGNAESAVEFVADVSVNDAGFAVTGTVASATPVRADSSLSLANSAAAASAVVAVAQAKPLSAPAPLLARALAL